MLSPSQAILRAFEKLPCNHSELIEHLLVGYGGGFGVAASLNAKHAVRAQLLLRTLLLHNLVGYHEYKAETGRLLRREWFRTDIPLAESFRVDGQFRRRFPPFGSVGKPQKGNPS